MSLAQGTPLALFVFAWTAAASAQASIPIRIDFDAPPGCSEAGAFYGGVQGRTARLRPAAEGEGGLRLSVRLSRVAGGVHGELRVIHEQGTTDTRKVDGVTCEEVVEALSLTAALALDPAARLVPLAPASPPAPSPSPSAPSPSAAAASTASASAAISPAPAPSPATPPVAASATPPAIPAAPRPPAPPINSPPAPVTASEPPALAAPDAGAPRSFGYELGIESIVAQVVSPGVSLGGALAARLNTSAGDPQSPSLGVALIFAPEGLQPARELAVGWTAVALSACPWRWSVTDVVSLSPCALAMGGWLAATDSAVSNPDSVLRSWWSAGAGVRAVVELGGGYALQIEVDATAPLLHRRFITTVPENTVGETPAISVLSALGVAYGL